MDDKYYTRVGFHFDLARKGERFFYRILEILPGFLSWATLIGMFLLSWLFPLGGALFILAFDALWFIRLLYYYLHLRAGYRRMREHEKTDWLAKLKELKRPYQNIWHLVILPMYKEELSIVRDSFKDLVEIDYPLDRLIVVLAVEERAGEEGRRIAKAIEEEFGKKFFKFLATFHPAGLLGEIPGKGSNETFAAKEVKEKIIDKLHLPYEKIITSVFDIDTKVFPKYFSCLTYYYLTSPHPERSSFQPIPLFINNIYEAPSFARVLAFGTTFWQMIQQERPEIGITFSSHSMSFKALVDIGFWQRNIVSEDSRIFWQCLLFYDGDYSLVSIYYPVAMDANVAKTFTKTLVNQYKQQRRWGWGVENTPYFLFGFFKNKKIPFFKKLHYTYHLVEGFWAWATSSFILLLMGWLPLMLGGEKFNQSLIAYNLPRITGAIMTIGMIGLVSSVAFSISLLPRRPEWFSRKKMPLIVLQWFLFPLTAIFLGSIPALESQTRLMIKKYLGFWTTEKTRRDTHSK